MIGWWRRRSRDGQHRLPLLGLMRVGTNVTRTVLEAHYAVQVAYNHLGWKHGLVPTFAPGCGWAYPPEAPLVVVKHPVAQLHSLYVYQRRVGRNLQAAGPDLAAFLRGRIVVRADELAAAPEYRFANPVQLWNGGVWNHLRYAQARGGLVLRYEDLLADPAAACARVAAHFRLAPRPDAPATLTLPGRAVRRMDDRPGRRRERYLTEEAFDKAAFFLEERYLADFAAEDLAFIERELDPDLVAELGYAGPAR